MATLHFCNICAVPSTKETPNIFLTCGHVLCKPCAKIAGPPPTNCTICGKIANFRDLDKLPDGLRKTFFMDDLTKVFDESLKVVDFQQQQEQKAYENMEKYRKGCKRLERQIEKEVGELRQKQAQAAKLKKHREQMQAKLAEMMEREEEQKKKPYSQRYRDRYETLSSCDASVSNTTTSTQPTISDDQGFKFTPDLNHNYFPSTSKAAYPSMHNSKKSDAGNKTPSRDRTRERSQSTGSSRTPFFS